MPIRLDFQKLDLMDALDLAVLIEAEAYDRYREFADQLGHRFPGDAASVFTAMASNEAKHGKALQDRRRQLFGDRPRRVRRDDLFDVEAPDQGAVRSRMSARQAFELALTAERRAFDFYDQALHYVQDPTIRELFTELRDEETEHVQMVQKTLAGLPASAAQEIDEDDDDLPQL